MDLVERVKRKMDELDIDFILLARIAHIHKYGTDPDQTRAYLDWKERHVVPIYVAEFVQ